MPLTATAVKAMTEHAMVGLMKQMGTWQSDFTKMMWDTPLISKLIDAAEHERGCQMAEDSRHRMRSFIERYMVERAKHFQPGQELEHGWQAIEQAKKLYGMIEGSAKVAFPDPLPETARPQAGQATSKACPPGPAYNTSRFPTMPPVQKGLVKP